MKNTVIILLEPSYIIRKGLITILLGINPKLEIRELPNVDLFYNVVKEIKKGLVIINKRSYLENRDLIEECIDLLTGEIIFLSVEDESRIKNNFTTIKYNDPKEVIISNLEKKLEKIKSKTDEQSGDLTERERTIVKIIATGLTNKEIAEQLNISMHTVITHRKNITGKLGIKTVSGLTIYAILNGLIDINREH